MTPLQDSRMDSEWIHRFTGKQVYSYKLYSDIELWLSLPKIAHWCRCISCWVLQITGCLIHGCPNSIRKIFLPGADCWYLVVGRMYGFSESRLPQMDRNAIPSLWKCWAIVYYGGHHSQVLFSTQIGSINHPLQEFLCHFIVVGSRDSSDASMDELPEVFTFLQVDVQEGWGVCFPEALFARILQGMNQKWDLLKRNLGMPATLWGHQQMEELRPSTQETKCAVNGWSQWLSWWKYEASNKLTVFFLDMRFFPQRSWNHTVAAQFIWLDFWSMKEIDSLDSKQRDRSGGWWLM